MRASWWRKEAKNAFLHFFSSTSVGHLLGRPSPSSFFGRSRTFCNFFFFEGGFGGFGAKCVTAQKLLNQITASTGVLTFEL